MSADLAVDFPDTDRLPCRFDFVSVCEAPARKLLSFTPFEIVRLLRQRQTDLIADLWSLGSVHDFREARKNLLARYIPLVAAAESVISAEVRRADVAGMAMAGLRVAEADFAARGLERIGAEATQEILFSLGTIGRTYRLLEQVISRSPAPDRRDADRALVAQFAKAAIWADLHIRLLSILLNRDGTFREDILTEVLDGARASVMMYATVRQALALRTTEEPQLFQEEDDELDPEDQELLGLCDSDPLAD